MPIEFRCKCGQKIRVPSSVAGKRARCQTCKAIFRIPTESSEEFLGTIPLEPAPSTCQTKPESEPGDWLNEFADSESNATGTEPVMISQMRTTELDAIDDDSYRPTDPESTKIREDRDWIVPPEKPFWKDMGESFFFFMDTGNMVTLVILSIISVVGSLVSFALGPFAPIGSALVMGYLCAFYMSTVVETAAGEDDLPSVSISNWLDDAIMPLFRFIGTWVLVLLPFLILTWLDLRLPPLALGAVAAIGAFFWPGVVLAVSIGGGFAGLWPHVIIRTALAAPLAYLAVWGVILIAAFITMLPVLTPFIGPIRTFMASAPARSGIFLFLLNQILSVYAMIVAMRAIGLFYRHFKHKLPWTAE